MALASVLPYDGTTTLLLEREAQVAAVRYLADGPPSFSWTRRSVPGSVVPLFLTQAATGVVLLLIDSSSMGVRIPSVEWRRRRLWKISMYSKIAFASSTLVFQ